VDLVLVDILLPGMDGLAFARLVKSSPDFGNVPVVATSAVTAWPFQRLSQMAGCDGFVQKPIDTRNLARELQDVAKKNA
jgi:CheY-like chemotaxis protein